VKVKDAKPIATAKRMKADGIARLPWRLTGDVVQVSQRARRLHEDEILGT
jgi:hypothetical protein